MAARHEFSVHPSTLCSRCGTKPPFFGKSQYRFPQGILLAPGGWYRSVACCERDNANEHSKGVYCNDCTMPCACYIMACVDCAKRCTDCRRYKSINCGTCRATHERLHEEDKKRRRGESSRE